nr:probable cytochrome P450 305a1 [Leptinotarsa decemlineata]
MIFSLGPIWLPIIGNLHQVKKLSIAQGGQHLAFSKLSQDYNSNVIGLKLGGKYTIVIASYPLVKTVLTSEEYDGRPQNFFMILRSLGTGKGITGTDGELWRIQKHFVSVHLRQLGLGKTAMDTQIQAEASEILVIIEENVNKELQIGQILPKSVLNILWMLMSGLRLSRNDDRLIKLLNLLHKRAKAFDMAGGTLNQMPWLRFVTPEWTGYNLIRNINEEFMTLLMEPIREHFKKWTDDRNDDLIYSFITEMRKAEGEKSTFTEDQLLMVCLDIFLAGAQTTSNTLDFAFLMMLLYPEIKNKVHACLDEAFQKSEEITYSERKRVPYVEAVLYETERFCTIAPIIGPRRVLRKTTLNGYDIPKDTTVLIHIHSVHNDVDYWQDPEIFRPDRFLDPKGNLMYHDRFLPFGLGKRRCLGEILAKNCIFTFFSQIMKSYQIELPPNAKKPTGVPQPGITLSPEKYRAIFIKR